MGERLLFLLLKIVALAGFSFYICWNIYWLSIKRIPPSIAIGVFGIPAPTTGMTRSVKALYAGGVIASLSWNPFTLPVIILTIISLIYYIRKVILKKGKYLPKSIVFSWGAVLLMGWIYKLIQGPTWW